MSYAVADDGVKLYYEQTGSGAPLVFVHEFAGDYRSWEPQVRHFSRYYSCVAYNARGYPPSDVPKDPAAYSLQRATADLDALITHLEVPQAHVVGLSMGSYTTLHFALTHPGRARSIAVAACGTGSSPDQRERFIAEVEATVGLFESQGSEAVAAKFAAGPTRVQFRNKDPRGWAEFARMFGEHSAAGSSLTMRGTQMKRPSVWDLADDLKKMTVPTLLMTGDENEPALEANIFLKRMIPTAGLVVFPNSGLTLNLEEPDAFNRHLQEFLIAVETGRWPSRDPQSRSKSALGVK